MTDMIMDNRGILAPIVFDCNMPIKLGFGIF